MTLIAAQLLAPMRALAADQPLPAALASDPDCIQYRQTRAMLTQIKTLHDEGKLNFTEYDSNFKAYDTLTDASTIGMSAAVVLVAAATATQRASPKVALWLFRATIGTALASFGAYVVGVAVSALSDSDRRQIYQVKQMLDNPVSLFTMSDFEACNNLLEYPQLRPEVEKLNQAAQHVLNHHINGPFLPSVETAFALKRAPNDSSTAQVAAPAQDGSNTVLR